MFRTVHGRGFFSRDTQTVNIFFAGSQALKNDKLDGRLCIVNGKINFPPFMQNGRWPMKRDKNCVTSSVKVTKKGQKKKSGENRKK